MKQSNLTFFIRIICIAFVIIPLSILNNQSKAQQAPVADFSCSAWFGSGTCDVNFTDLSTNNPASWFWDFGDGNTDTVQNPWHIYPDTLPGIYTVTLIVTSAFGSDTAFGMTQVDSSVCQCDTNTFAFAPIADFSCSPVSSGTWCTVSFTDFSTNNPTSWFWDFGNGDTDTVQNPWHCYTGFSDPAGIYTVTLTVTNTFGSDVVYSEVLHDPNAWICEGCIVFDKGNVSGKVFNDINANCIHDTGEISLSNWLVKLEPGPSYSVTDNNGFYSVLVDTGTYTAQLIPLNSLWQQNCPVSPNYYTIDVFSVNGSVTNINFGLQADVYCPDLNIDISTLAVRPCLTSSYSVNYCNNGTIAATNATIEIELDSNLTYLSGTGNLISQVGNTLTFDINTVNSGQCGSFNFSVNVACDMSLVGSTMCVKAHIYPDSSCVSPDSIWDKSSIAVEGVCISDSLACFTIYNTGDPGTGDMQGASEYRIYENNILVYIDIFQLAGGDSLVVCWAANGNTIRLEADQRPGHPGNSHPQDNVEMCGGPPQTLGQINLIPQDDADDFMEIDCQVVTAPLDPNEKRVIPEGLTETYHYIDSTDILEYTIHFQNTGTDTAFRVIILDTLSPYLDITTIQPGASSHPYTIDILDSNVLEWRFNNILLPDSNINEPESHGFVKYKIYQKPGNQIGTVIQNNVAIIFDFNAPVITNTVFNTIGNIDSLTIISCDSLSISVAENNVTCNGYGDGSADLTVSGGTPVYSYLWSNGATTQDISIIGPGTYYVTGTDANGCTIIDSVTISEPPEIVITTSDDILICIGMSAVISAYATGGTGGLNYAWSDSSISGTGPNTVYPVTPTTYIVTVTDSLGCTKMDSITVTVNPLLIIFTVSDSICVGDSTTISATVTGGDGNYVYFWNTGDINSVITVYPETTTTYILTVNDGCGTPTAIDSVVVIVSSIITTFNNTGVNCNGGNDGNATVTASGGTAPYTYQWDDPASQTTAIATGLAAGIYIVNVTDLNGCIATAVDTINEPAPLILSTDSLPDTVGTGVGMAWVTVSGGTLPYYYQWDDPASQTTGTASNLLTGTYNVVVTDSNGCNDSSSATVGNFTGISDWVLENNIRIYPNPNPGMFNLEIGGIEGIGEIRVLNILAKEIYKEFVIFDKQILTRNGTCRKQIDLANQPDGIYILQVHCDFGVITRKVILH